VGLLGAASLVLTTGCGTLIGGLVGASIQHNERVAPARVDAIARGTAVRVTTTGSREVRGAFAGTERGALVVDEDDVRTWVRRDVVRTVTARVGSSWLPGAAIGLGLDLMILVGVLIARPFAIVN
jgi:hypothetical protein